MLSIIIPIFNEVNTLQTILDRVEAVKLPIKKEIVLVDDFSTDGTRDILKTLAKKKKYKIIFHKKNGGKGRAVRTGLQHATGDWFIIQDADLEYDPNEYPKLLAQTKQYQVIYGSRFLNQTFFSQQRWAIPSHYVGNRFLSILTSLLYGQWITDMETCYKLFSRKALESIALKAQRFDLEPEITAKFIKQGFKIKEVPITYHPRSFAEGKKIGWRDGITALWVLFKCRFN